MQTLGQSYYRFTDCSITNGIMHLVLTGQNEAKIDVELSCSEAQQLVNEVYSTVLDYGDAYYEK
jgi:hypothetical protein